MPDKGAGIKGGLPGDATYSYDGVGRVIEVDYGHSEKRTLDYLDFLNLPRKIQKGNFYEAPETASVQCCRYDVLLF